MSKPTPTVFYHRTPKDSADSILRDGFRDHTGHYLTDQSLTGVWLSDRPLDINEGIDGAVLLKVRLHVTEEDIGDYECVEDGKPYREWVVPASFVQEHLESIEIDDEDEILTEY